MKSPVTIICLSANPALDRRLRLETLRLGDVNRATVAEPFPGGKAAHVAMASRALGAHSVWIGFLGGALGEECSRGLKKLQIEVLPIRIEAQTRANLEVIERSGRVTEILEPGGRPTAQESSRMLRECRHAMDEKWPGASLVISGSLPAGVSSEFYEPFIRAAHSSGSPVFVDTSGRALSKSLTAGPDFVKPNWTEIEFLMKRKLRSTKDVVVAASELIRRGAKSVAITRGAKGLVWVERKKGRIWNAVPPKLRAISTVGSGDATLAGFAVARARGLRGEPLIRFATACGAANCLASNVGQISIQDVKALIPAIRVNCIE